MKYLFTCILFFVLGAGCKPKVLSGVELQNKLVETMGDYLHKTLRPGTQFKIKDVVYYTEKAKKFYICEFHVTVHLGNKDTTGVMTASITNDFSNVRRTQ